MLECLDSLRLKGGNIRKDEIGRPVLTSNQWIWEHPSLSQLLASNAGALAIIGKAGSGKSVLAKTIQEGISRRWKQLGLSSDDTDPLVGGWFYCRRRGDVFTAYSSLLRNVLSEFLLERKSLFVHYRQLHRHRLSARSQTWTTEELEQILEKINTSGLDIVMIFDAIDEAGDDRIVSFIETLVSRPASSIKAILLARPTEAFDRCFWESRRVTLQWENARDIHLVVEHGLAKLKTKLDTPLQESESGLSFGGNREGPIRFKTHTALRRQTPASFPAPATTRGVWSQRDSLNLDLLGNNIRDRAAGVVLWVVLVFDSLFKYIKREPIITLERLMSCAAELPHDIDAFYGRMVIDLAEMTSPAALRTARAALMWINVASQYKPFTMEELWDALAASPEGVDGELGGSCSTEHSLVNRRVAIQSWNDFNRILRRLCGSLIEVLPPRSASTTTPSAMEMRDSTAVSGGSIVQLMHQTVKDFLTSSPGAGALSFGEAVAQQHILRGCQIFMKLALPDEIDSIIPVQRNRPEDWPHFSAHMARYLEEFRLFPLCSQLFSAFPEATDILQTQLNMKWTGMLPHWFPVLAESNQLDLVKDWKYDYAALGLGLSASALGVMFQFSACRGLQEATRNLLTIMDMGDNTRFWPMYRDVVLNAITFTVLERPDLPSYSSLRARLLTPGGSRRESAIIALDNRYWENTTCRGLLDGQELNQKAPAEEVVAAVEVVMACLLDESQMPHRGFRDPVVDTEALFYLSKPELEVGPAITYGWIVGELEMDPWVSVDDLGNDE